MAIPTISQTILRGDISIYLAANNNASGVVWGIRKAAPGSAVTIAMVTDALRWGVDSQTSEQQRSMANYLIWLIGYYGQQAQAIIDGGGGGSVIPIPPAGDVPTPITISGGDFANATDWEYPPYAGKPVTVFSNGIARYLTGGGVEWEYISTGIRITQAGFDSSSLDYTLVITIIR